MIILDTHVWIWWNHDEGSLNKELLKWLDEQPDGEIGISIISCWEIAKLVEKNRVQLPIPVEEWLNSSLKDPSIRLLNLTPRIVVEATQLPAEFHRDPADQMITATARVHDCSLVTRDQKILDYPHVETIKA